MIALAHNWDSFLYLFLVGGVIFVISLLLPLRSGDIDLKRRYDRRLVVVVVLTAVLYLAVYLLWQFAAIERGGV